MTQAKQAGKLQGAAKTRINSGLRFADQVRPRTYEITFTGEAGPHGIAHNLLTDRLVSTGPRRGARYQADPDQRFQLTAH